MQASPAPRRRLTRRRVLTLAGVLLGICCAGGVGGGWVLFNADRQENDEIRQAAEGFVIELETNDHAGAYERLCPDTRAQFSADAFIQRVRGESTIRSHEIRTVTVNTVDRRRRAMVTMDLTFVNGSTARHTFPLTKVDDAWQVCGQPY